MEIKEIVKEAILSYAILSIKEEFIKLPPERKVDVILYNNTKLSALAKETKQQGNCNLPDVSKCDEPVREDSVCLCNYEMWCYSCDVSTNECCSDEPCEHKQTDC